MRTTSLAALLAALLLPLAAHAQPAVVRGVVRDSAARPIAMAEVIVDDSLRARSDSAGRFALTNLPAGEVELTVRRVGYAPLSIPLRLDAGRTRTLAIELSAFPYQLRPVIVSAGRRGLFGTVVDAAGAPIDSAEVFVIGAGQVATTNRDGAFAVSGLPASTYMVRVRREGHHVAQFTVPLPPDAGQEVRVQLDPLGDGLRGWARRLASGFGTLDAVRLRDFDARMRVNTHYLIPREVLERSRKLDIADVLRNGDVRPIAAAPRGELAPSMRNATGDRTLDGMAVETMQAGAMDEELLRDLGFGGICWFEEGEFSMNAGTTPADWIESVEVMRHDDSRTLARRLPSGIPDRACRLFVVIWYRR